MPNLTKKQFYNSDYFYAVILGVLLFLFSVTFNYIANIYAENSASYAVTDVILNHTKVYNLDDAILVVTGALIVFGLYEAFTQPKKLPFLLKSTALFIFVRSISITLTHIGPFSPHLVFDTSGRIISLMGLGNSGDLFFSGHTGMPFLWTLIFWEKKVLRYIFMAGSVALGTFVLLAHLHYSIDVFSAFFITYSIFHISQKVFADDWRMFKS